MHLVLDLLVPVHSLERLVHLCHYLLLLVQVVDFSHVPVASLAMLTALVTVFR